MIYVLSDIHGNERRFHSILKQIDLRSEDTLYILGDVIDRHPCGIRILRRIMSMPNAKMLLGNHEYMMLRALGCPYEADDPACPLVEKEDALEHWYENGGKVTHDYWKRLRKSLRKEMIDYLRALPVNIDIELNGKAYKLVHSAPLEEYGNFPGYPSPVFFAVWKRWRRFDQFAGDYTMIFGHTPTDHYRHEAPNKIWYSRRGSRCIGIDCGSGYPEEYPYSRYGRLACLRLDDGKEFYSEEDI